MDNDNESGPKAVESHENAKLNTEEEKERAEEEDQENIPLSEQPPPAASSPEKDDLKMALSDDPTKVKFTNSEAGGGNQNGEAKVDIENVQLAFAGMGKEELMSYAEDPFWVKLRWSLFGLFWLLWAAMLVGAIIIVVTTPGCPPLPARDWWQKGVIYQVYPKSFKDSNGDGVGDLKGIESELSYFKELGVNTLWLNPIFKSPMDDGGYDISDFIDIDPTFGTIDDFKSLLKSAHDQELKIVLDYVPNHSSIEHEWFQKSRQRVGNYTDYYIWEDGKAAPPNNWLSVFGKSAWTLDEVRGQYYYHQFLPSQPDLNLRNDNVRKELKDILKFWLDLGVDGFRVDAAKHLFEDEALIDEPPKANISSDIAPTDHNYLDHIYTTGQPDNLNIIREWREFLHSYEENDGNHRLMMVEAYEDLEKVMSYYGNETDPLADFPFNFALLNLNEISSAQDVASVVSSWISAVPTGKWSNWVLGNHDVGRLASRTSTSLVDAYNMIIMLLDGTPVTYYGEEIGMVNVPMLFAQTRDKTGIRGGEETYLKTSRDFQRTPMQWNGELEAGFTNSSNPWLPISPDYKVLNVEQQRSDPESHLEIYKKLVKLRKEPAFLYGRSHFPHISEDIFAFLRVKKGSPGYAIVVNFGKNVTNVDIAESGPLNDFKLPDTGLVELRSGGGNATISQIKSKVSLKGFDLGPSEAVVINFVPKFE